MAKKPELFYFTAPRLNDTLPKVFLTCIHFGIVIYITHKVEGRVVKSLERR